MRVRLKITLVMLGLLAVLFGAGGSALIAISFNTAYEQEKQAAISAYQMTLSTLSMVSQIEEWKDSKSVSDTLERLRTQNVLTMDALKLSSESQTMYQSDVTQTGAASNSGALHTALKQIDNPLQLTQCVFSNFEYDQRHYLQVKGMLNIGEEILYLDAAYDINAAYEVRAEQQDAFYKVFAILLVVCAILTYLVTWLLTRPLIRLSKASKELAEGNLSYRANVNTNDEISELADDFNTMAAQLEQGFNSLKSTMAHQDRFMASFAHELKTPMTSIIGFAELLRSQTLTEEERMDAAHYIFSEGKRLESLSFKMLEIMANDPGVVQMLRVSPNKLIGELVDHLRPIYEKDNITLAYKGAGGSFMMEPDLIKSLVINLLDNARKAMPEGGTISIEVKASKGECLIRVTDNGKGIPEKSLAHLTEAFYRVDKSRAREQGGVGLGLTLCARIVKLHNGHMRFESQQGVGTRISVILKRSAT